MRCGGDEFESEGSILKYVTEGENAVNAADRCLFATIFHPRELSGKKR